MKRVSKGYANIKLEGENDLDIFYVSHDAGVIIVERGKGQNRSKLSQDVV